MTEETYEQYKQKMNSYQDREVEVIIGKDEKGKNVIKPFKFNKYGALIKDKIENERYSYSQTVELKQVDGDLKSYEGLQTLVDFIEKHNVTKLNGKYLGMKQL